jgi:hypothetical protein
MRPLNRWVVTVLVLLWDFAAVVFLALLLEGGGGVEEYLEVEYAYFLVGDVLVDAVLAFLGNGDAHVCLSPLLLRMMFTRS